MMQKILNYIRLEGGQTFNILEELKELKFKKKQTLLYNFIRYSLLLRCNSGAIAISYPLFLLLMTHHEKTRLKALPLTLTLGVYESAIVP